MAWEWAPPSWEAFATLATGLAAVGGAVVVGRRQARINERQADIQAQLAQIENDRLKMELFDRRMAIFRAVQDFLVATLQDGVSPKSAGHLVGKAKADAAELHRRFVLAKDEARFLFRPSVADDMSKIYAAASQHDYFNREAANGRGGNDRREMMGRNAAHRFEILQTALSDLNAIFGPDLAIGPRDYAPGIYDDLDI